MYINNAFSLIVFSLLSFLLGISGVFRLSDPMGSFDRVLGLVLVVLGFPGAFIGIKTWWEHRKLRKFVINHTLSLGCNTIVVGMNKDWKREVNLGKRTNQSFVHISYQTFLHQLQYKAEQHGIRVIVTEEGYTSKCSFLDMEEMKKQKQYKGKRIKRGLFQSEKGTLIHADVNGAYNIMRKVFPKAFADGIAGVGLHPIRVHVA